MVLWYGQSSDEEILPGAGNRRKSKLTTVWMSALALFGLFCVLHMVYDDVKGNTIAKTAQQVVLTTYRGFRSIEWRTNASFRVTDAMKVSIGMSMALGILLGIGVGLISGLEPAVVIGVSASMAMGCVFVMSFAVLHGVNALRAVTFAIFVSVCLPVGFGFGFGVGILAGVFLGLEEADEIRDKTKEFVIHFVDFVKVVIAFTLEIL